jgi:hypothetical protein
VSFHYLPHFRGFRAIEKEAGRTDELERVPLDRIMARRDSETASRLVVLDRELNGWSWNHSDIEYIASNRLERGVHDRLEHGAGHAAVTTNDDARFATGACQSPGAEAGRELRNDLRR